MKNLKTLSQKSSKGITPLYYSILENAVYSDPGDGRYHVTDLIRHNTEKEIEQTVKRFMGV